MSPAAEPGTRNPAEIVTSFLVALQENELDAALELLTPDAVWINVSLPTVRGRDRIERVFRLGPKTGTHFRVHFHNVAAHGNVVLTERTDALGRGRFEQRFWVYGRFELADGRIKVWRDSFDWLDLLVSLVRGAAGALVPALNRPWPGDRAAAT
jgi:limonene-1,2-epoxide hydrolase